jgi:predicted ATPase/class 3 adenylate cyclase/Tfp pilus assembly protein PilF
MREQPTGSVTLVFTDIEGSTRLLHELGAEAYRDALAEHRRVVREAFASGYEVDEEGDAFFYAFPTVTSAVAAVEQAMHALDGGPIRVRVGVHTGEPVLDPPKYVGLDVHRAARVMAAAHGGQVLLSESTRTLLDDQVVARDLGEHRLKDLSGPQRLYQLGAEEFPRLKTLHQTNLPVAWTRLVGRERDIEELLELLRREDVSVVTLTGAGGGGKTRLAMQVAADAAEDYAGGVWFVGLAALTDVDLVEAAIAQTFGLREGGGRTYRDVVGDFLRSRRLLLVLDNLEQLLPGVAGLVADLAAEFAGVDFLATSREPLRIGAEREYTVPPLASDESVMLFAERANLELDGDRLSVEAICARLDGLPLAIELAAARVNVLRPAKLLERLEQRLPLLTSGLRDAPVRQRTLRATIAWSHDLLDDHEQQLFARLAVFERGCTLEAGEAVCDADVDTLGSLLDKNLLRRDESRYRMLETIREFARERFDEAADADEIRRRHAEHFLAFSLEAQPELGRRDQRQWFDRLEADHDNLGAALSWLLDHVPENALTLAHALVVFWYTRGHVREGRDWLLAALEHASATASATRASALDWAGYLSYELSEDAGGLLEQAVACAREADAAAEAALALSHLQVSLAHDDTGIAILEDALAIAEQAGDPFVLATVLNNLGVQMSEQGDTERARELYEESYRIRAEMGDLSRMSLSLVNLSDNAFAAGDVSRARDYATQALALAREVGDRRHMSAATDELAWLALAEGDIGEARELFNEALTLSLRIANLSNARITLHGLAAVAAASGDGPSAARLAAAAKPDVHGHQHLGPAATATFARHLATAEAQTDPDTWDEAWATGAALTIEQAAAEILQT